MVETQLLNAMLERRDFEALVRYGINHEKFFIQQKEAFQFIKKHLKTFGEYPDVATVYAECPTFEQTETSSSMDALCQKVIEQYIKNEEKKLMREVSQGFSVLDGFAVLERFKEKVSELQEIAYSRGRDGSNWAQNGVDRFEEYQVRSSKDFSTRIPCLFKKVGNIVGDYGLGELVVFMAFTGKGKSWLGSLQALMAHKAGFRVLIESAEMSRQDYEFRLDSLNAGFSNRDLWKGSLENEEEYKEYTDEFYKGNGKADLIIKEPKDWANGLTIEQIELDIDKHKPSMVVIDQFSLIRTKRNGHEDRAALSQELKLLAARKSVVIVLLYQTSGESQKKIKKDENGEMPLSPPTKESYSQTISVIQDANKIFGLDTQTFIDEETGKQRGVAKFNVIKNREGGGESMEFDLIWCPNDGQIRTLGPEDAF